jgi:predicted GH43/DUF377 family glycosyl hydrolase
VNIHTPGRSGEMWELGPFRKYASNPIMTIQGSSWESHALYNPAAWTDGRQVYLLYRAEGPCDFPGRAFTSRIGLAISDDGIHFRREEQPVLVPTEPYEIPGGCEDPRVVQIDGVFYLTYTAFDGAVARLAMARSTDLRIWTKLGLMFADETWDRYFDTQAFPETPRGWSKSAALLTEKIDGRYWMYFGDTNIWAASSSDLQSWDIAPEPVMRPRPGSFDSRLIEPGPPPLLREDGIWLAYNSADTQLRYAMGEVLLDRQNPTRVLRRSETPVLEPTIREELEGQVPQVVFGEGLVFFQGQWLLYFGMADSRLGVAMAS